MPRVDLAVAAWEAELGPSRLVFGAGSIDRLGELTRTAGGTRALLVTDPGVRDAGHVERGLAALRAATVETEVFDGVGENPNTAHVAAGVESARGHAADCIVAVGGGSALDCAKGINFLVTNGGRMEDYWGAGKAEMPLLPSLGVPTTAGTGSEAQSYTLISQAETRVKMACGDKKAMFRTVILDPGLAATVPRDVAAVSGIDAISHAVESFVTLRRNPVSQTYAREAWRLLVGNLEQVLTGTAGLEAWGRMQVGAFLAGAAIEQSMLGAAHACANPLTARFRVPHGIAVALMLPHVVRFNAAHVGALYDELRRAADDARKTALLEDRLVRLRTVAGLPQALRDYSIPHGCLTELAAEAEQQWTAAHNPRPVGRAELLELYEAAY